MSDTAVMQLIVAHCITHLPSIGVVVRYKSYSCTQYIYIFLPIYKGYQSTLCISVQPNIGSLLFLNAVVAHCIMCYAPLFLSTDTPCHPQGTNHLSFIEQAIQLTETFNSQRQLIPLHTGYAIFIDSIVISNLI